MPQKLDLSFAEGSLLRRGLLTMGALAAYCVGSWIMVPGVDASTLIGQESPGWLSSAIGRISILALGMVPLLSALVLAEIVLIAAPPLRRWTAASEANETSFNGWIVLLSLAIAGYQANGIAVGLEGIDSLVPQPGLAFRAGVIATLVAGTAFLIWLAALVTRHGVGSGFLLLLAAPLLMAVPSLFPSHALTWGDASQLTIPLTLAAFLAAASLLTLAHRVAPEIAGTGQLLWPVLIAYTIAPWLLLSLLLVFPPETFLGALEGLKPGQPWRLVSLPALTLVVYLLRDRSLREAGSTPAGAEPVLPVVLVVLAVAVSELLIYWLPAPLAFDGKNVAILVAFALALIGSLGLRHSSAAAPDSKTRGGDPI
jgi:hypothetical protein